MVQPTSAEIEAGFAAVYKLIHKWGTSVEENARIWRAIAAYAEATEGKQGGSEQ